METYSKALNAGQYPLSVLAVNERAAGLYRKGVYDNTMTTNPRAMDVAVAVLDGITPELRTNIRERGAEFVNKLNTLRSEEHTSELQSLMRISYAVFCLTKKMNNEQNNNNTLHK